MRCKVCGISGYVRKLIFNLSTVEFLCEYCTAWSFYYPRKLAFLFGGGWGKKGVLNESHS